MLRRWAVLSIRLGHQLAPQHPQSVLMSEVSGPVIAGGGGRRFVGWGFGNGEAATLTWAALGAGLGLREVRGDRGAGSASSPAVSEAEL